MQNDLKHIYDELWQGRNIEISNLWQRSAILIAVLVAVFTLYGGLWKVYLEDKNGKINCLFINLLFSFICLLGVVSSYFWVRMAQGSKYWIEQYERAINEIYESDPICSISNLPHHGKMPKPYYYLQADEYRWDKTLFATCGVSYSPSRINIAIGQVLLIVWTELFSFHFLSLFMRCYLIKVFVLIIILIGFIVMILKSGNIKDEGKYWIKSGSKKEHKENNNSKKKE